jgi:hypothetical protein
VVVEVKPTHKELQKIQVVEVEVLLTQYRMLPSHLLAVVKVKDPKLIRVV